jgi:hypothetical protein
MPMFRKKPVVIEAVQWTGEYYDADPLPEWLVQAEVDRTIEDCDAAKVIKTLEGEHLASPGDWIIQGIKGELYPCKPDIFAATYETAPSPVAA